MAIVEEGLGSALGEAVVLLIDRLIEAVLIGLQIQGAGKEGGVLQKRLWIPRRHGLDGCKVFFDAGLFEACLREVLGGADKDSGASLNGRAEGGEVPPVSGARKRMACWASSGTVIVAPSSRTFCSRSRS